MNKMIITGAAAAIFLILAALSAPLLTSYDYKAQDLNIRLAPPDAKHIFGTDELGRDVFSRMLYGARVSMTVGIIAVLISAVIGILFGAVAGFFGGFIDNIIMRFVDIMLTIPTLFLILMLIVFLGPSIVNVMIIIGLTSWTDIARLIRAEVMSVKKLAYIDADRRSEEHT